MTQSIQLIRARRFLPLFVTQLLGAFNDNLFKNAMVLFVVYSVYNSESSEAIFSAVASLIFVMPFFLFSALAGQLADMRDKAAIIRTIKLCEILIMLVGGLGLALAWKGIAMHTLAIPLLLVAVFAMGVHSTFFGPIKYAILPQHLEREEVLAGTGLVEAGTYLAVLAGTIVAGWVSVDAAAIGVIGVAIVGYISGRSVPPAPPIGKVEPLDFHLVRAPVRLIRSTLSDRRVYLAVCSISFFWALGTILFIQFPPLAKNILMAAKEVASLFLVIFSVGIAIGSIVINALLKGKVSARWSPIAVIAMALCLFAFELVCEAWHANSSQAGLMDVATFVVQPLAVPLMLSLLGVAIAGGMFVVPLYAFLTTFVEKSQTARTIAANNVVNSGAMVLGGAIAVAMNFCGLPIVKQLLVVSVSCLASAWLAHRLYRAERQAVEPAPAR
ncbi:MFS transporter [Novosphingobium profundi]|uniref:MFS transporter n=1 Tax=Novosphingobium profundi TaxID=1774954 RepID=UPI001BDA522C|nr:MFS transporter [Novosphingobium profundi]MBT0668088.1 MFS transporter [Novosphingobium profundi]